MDDTDLEALRAAIAALEGQRATLGDAVLELATAPLRARLAALQRPAGLQFRQVTLLFIDVVGSSVIAHGLGAQDTLEALSGALRHMAAIVKAHQGRVLKFAGHGVKAAFGVDEAREDCLQVLGALDDARAAPMLEQLHADVQTRATQITEATDLARLIQSIPNFRGIAAAFARRGEPPAVH